MPASVWRGYITFGLVTIPVKLYRAARAERVKLREVYRARAVSEPEPEVFEDEPAVAPDGLRQGWTTRPILAEEPPLAPEPLTRIAPIQRAAAGESGAILPATSVVKGFEFEKGRYVPLDRAELKALAVKTSTEMDLLEFVDLASVDPIYFETSYYVRPEPSGEKPYALLYESLKATQLVGVARMAMHQREHIVLLRSGTAGLIAHTMYFGDEVRADQEYRADAALVNAKELELANTLVRALKAEFDPRKYRDTYLERLEQIIAGKAAEQPPGAKLEVQATQNRAPDIMDALRKSLAELKKPAASERPRQASRAPLRKRG
jgi:DNA end-binding protein Ku